MKIINQDQNQISLKDSNISGAVIGIIMLLGAGYFSYHTYSTAGASPLVWIALAVAVFGLIMLLINATISVTIDKVQNQITFIKKRLLGTVLKKYTMADALRVELRRSFHMNPGTRGANGMNTMPTESMSYQSVIVMKDGNELPLENVKSSGSSSIGGVVLMGGTGKELSTANQVANFLNVPLQEVGPGSAPTIIGPGAGGINIGL